MLKELIKKVTYPIIKSSPDFLIIGAQKAGTTSLYRYLTEHSQILGNKSWKEIRYFDLPENYNQGFSWYLGNFPSKLEKKNRLTFDASPSYLYFKHIPKLIKKDLGDIKMIALLRNPVSRAYSAWQMYHSFSDNPHEHLRSIADERTFPEAIEQELNPETNTAGYPYDYIDRGKYVEQLENYYQYFDRNRLLVLNIDSFKENLGSSLNPICDFLEIQHFSQETIHKLQDEKHNVNKYQFSSIDDKVKADLREYFTPFNEKLYQLLNCRYNWS